MILPALEEMAARDSWVHRRLPEAKLIAFPVLTVAIVSETEFSVRLGVYGVVAGMLGLLSGLPFGYIAKRVGLVLAPLAVAALLGWWNGTLDPRLILARGALAALLLTLLAATTRSKELIGGMERLHLPGVIPMLTASLYRFVPLLLEEWRSMHVARVSRTPGRPHRMAAVTLARQIANLLTRAWIRAERTQAAMESRGFTGHYQRSGARAWQFADVVFAAGLAALGVGIRAAI